MTQIIKFQEKEKEKIINYSAEILRKGGLIVFPSDTVYGLLAKADDKQAVKKLIFFKNRPPGKPISIFVSNFLMLKKYVTVAKNQEQLLKEILPGPFTIILPSKHKVCLLLESEKKTLGVRLTKFNLINQLVEKLEKPLTATSANLSGQPPHYSIESFFKKTPKNKLALIDLIIDYGKLPKNKPSTVIDLSSEEIKILRQGDIKFTQKLSFISKSEEETKKIAQKIINVFSRKNINKSIILLLKGELGVGKTVFTKGIGEFFNINNIVSPSFVTYYEYFINSDTFKKLYHFDFYNIKEKEEFKYLGLEKIFREKNLIIIEWGEKAGDLVRFFEKRSKIVLIEFNYLTENKRKIEVKFDF